MSKSLYQALREKFDAWLTHEPKQTDILPYDFNRLKYGLKPGDVLLVEGRSRVSSVIRTLTQSPWTHAAIYIGRLVDFEDEEIKAIIRKHTDASDTTRLIIEDLMDRGTVITPMTFYHNHHIRVCRPVGITPTDLQLVIHYMIKSLGQPYNVRQLLDLARFLLPWTILPRRWGSSLFRKSTGEPEPGVCSSLIAEAFISVQFPILPFVKPEPSGIELYHRNPYLFTPKDFDYSPYFEIIKYPLFNPDEPLPYYRRLPWAKNGLMHHDEVIQPQSAPKPKKRLRIFSRKKDQDEPEKNETPTVTNPQTDKS